MQLMITTGQANCVMNQHAMICTNASAQIFLQDIPNYVNLAQLNVILHAMNIQPLGPLKEVMNNLITQCWVVPFDY